MSSTIDERVVEMRFDNQKFEKNARTTMKTLEALDKSLELKGSTKGFQDLEKAAKSVDLSHLEKSLDFLANKFTFFGKIGDKVITDLSHKFTNFFEKIAKSFTTDQITSGWAKYEAKTQAVQVIMHATGKSIEEVNDALVDLAQYTDDTSYSYDQMIDAIGKFTGAGIELEDAEKAAEGIANWAATSGVSASRAAGAFYNLSQAMGSGSLKYMDWKSLENLSMGTVEFREKAIEVAQAMIADGRASKEMASAFKKAGPTVDNFRDSLASGWLDKDVMLEVFKAYADRSTEFGRSAYYAAYEAKSFTDAVEAAKEAVATGWANVFEQIFGNYEEAKVFWTEVADAMIAVFSTPINALADFLTEWHKQGGYVAFIDSIRNAWAGVKAIGEAVGEVFRNVFPPIDPSVWVEKTQKLEQATKRWMSSLTKIDANEELQELFASGDMDAYLAKLTEVEEHNDAVDKKLQPLRDTLQGVFAILKLVKSLSSALFKIVLPFTKLLVPIANLVGTITGALGRVSSSIADAILNSELFNGILALFAKVANVAVTAVTWLGNKLNWLIDNVLHLPVIETFVNFIKELGSAIHGLASPYIEKIANAFKTLYSTLSKFISENLSTIIEGIGKALQYIGGVFIFAAQTVWKFLQPAFSAIGRIFRSLYNSIKSFVERQNLSEVFERIGAGVTAFCDAIGNAADVVWNWLKPAFDWFIGIVEDAYNAVQTYLDSTDFDEILDDIADALTNFGGAVIYAAGAVWDWLQPAFQGIANVAGRIWERIKVLADGIKDYWNNVVIPSGVLNYIIQGMKNLAKNAKNLALSLVEYIKNSGLFGIYEWVRDKFSEIWNLIKSFNFSKLIGDSLNLAKIGGILAGILALYRTTRLLKNVGTFLKEFPKSLKAYSKGLGIKRVATAILMIAGALYVLSLVPPGRLWELVGAIAALGGILTLFTVALGFFAKSMETTSSFTKEGGKFTRTTNSITKAVAAMLVMATSILILSVALKKLSDIDSRTLWNSVGALTVIMLAFAASAVLIGTAKTSVVQVGIGMLALASGIWLMVLAIDQVNKLFAGLQTDQETLTKVVWVISGIAIVLMGLAFVLKKVEKATFELAAMIAAIGAAVLLVALAAKLMTTLGWEELAKAGVALLGLVGILALLMLVTKLIPKDTSKKMLVTLAATIVGMGVSLLIFVSAVKSLGEMDADSAKAGLRRLAAIMAMIAVVMLSATFVGSIGKTFVGLAAAIAIIVIVIRYLSDQDWGKMLNGTAMLYMVIVALGRALKSGSKALGSSADWKIGFGIAAVVLSIAGALWIITLLDLKKAWSAAGVLSGVLIALGVSLKLAGAYDKSADWKVGLGLTAVIVGIAVALLILTQLPIPNLIASAIALGALMEILGHTMGRLKSIDISPKQSGKLALAIASVIGPLVGALALMMLVMKIGDNSIAEMITIAGALAILIPDLAGSIAIISRIGSFPKPAEAGKLALAISAVLLPIVVALAAAKRLIPDPRGLLTISTAISEVLLSLIAPFIALSLIGKFAGADGILTGAAGFGVFVAISGFITAILGWIGELEGAQELFEAAVPIAQNIGRTIGGLIGGLLEGIIGGIGAGLGTGLKAIAGGIEVLGASLQTFMECVAVGCEAIDNAPVDAEKIDAIGALAKAMFIFASAEFVDAITNLINFLPKLLHMDTDEDFSAQMQELGEGLQAFSTATEEMSMFDATKAKIAAAAIEGLTSAAANLGREGGWLDKIAGKPRKLSAFARELGESKDGFEAFVNDVVPVLTKDGLEGKIETVANVIAQLSSAAGQLGREGGWVDAVVGHAKNLGTFAGELGDSKEGFEKFANMANNISGYTSQMTSVTGIIKDLVEIANLLGTEGGMKAWFTGNDRSLTEFLTTLLGTGSITQDAFAGLSGLSGIVDDAGNTLDVLGTEYKPPRNSLAAIISDFAKQMSVIDLDQLQHASDAMTMFFGMLSGAFGGDTDGSWMARVQSMVSGDQLANFLTAFKPENLSGLTAFDGVYSESLHRRLSGFVSVFRNVAGIETTPGFGAGLGLKTLASNLGIAALYLKQTGDNLGVVNYTAVQSMIDFFMDNLEKITNLGKPLIHRMLSAMVEEGSLQATETANEIAYGITDVLNNGTYSTKFFNTGVMLVKGFKSGIESQISSVERMATTLSERTITAMRRALRIESPSKVMRQIGDYTGEGYYLGLQDWLNPSATAGEELAQATTESVLGMLDYIQGIMNGDLVVDMRIRPVLDLSEVRLSFGQLDSMFSQRQAIMAQLNAEDLSHRDEVAELVDVSWKILKEIQNGRVVYLDGKVVANSVNNRLGRMEG